MQNNQKLRPLIKKIVLISIALIVALVAWTLYRNYRDTSTIVITADDNVRIAVATEAGGEFKPIGNGSTEYRTRGHETVFVRGEQDDAQAIVGLFIEKGQHYTVEIEPDEPVTAEEYYPGSVADPYVNGERVQGISNDGSITSFHVNEFESPRLDFYGIPYLRRIVWEDSNNFAYVSFGGGVGVFRNGTDQEANSLAQPSLTDVARADNDTTVFIDSQTIYTSDDLGRNLQEVTNHNVDEPRNLFADQDYIYLNSETPPSAYASEADAGDSGNDDFPEENTTHIFDYEGNELTNITTEGGMIKGAVSLDDTIVMLGEEVVSIFNTTSETNTPRPLYFSYARDITIYNDTLYVLADDGLWALNPELAQFSRVFSFSEYGVGLQRSLATDNGQSGLMFGTTNQVDGPSTDNYTFRIRPTGLRE